MATGWVLCHPLLVGWVMLLMLQKIPKKPGQFLEKYFTNLKKERLYYKAHGYPLSEVSYFTERAEMFLLNQREITQKQAPLGRVWHFIMLESFCF